MNFLKFVRLLLVTAVLFATVGTNVIQAGLVINEISPSTNPEWVEIFNDSGSEVNLAGYLLEDGNNITIDDIILYGLIPAHGFLVFTHAEGWLNNDGDTLKFYNNATPSAILDQYSFGSLDSSKTFAKIPNGGPWQTTSNITNGSSNPTPTPAPTPTPTPTIFPTTTPSPTPSKSPTPTPVKTKSPTPSPTLESQVLSAETTSSPSAPQTDTSIEVQDSVNDMDKKQSNPRKNVMVVALTLMGFGSVLFGVGGVAIYRKSKQPS